VGDDVPHTWNNEQWVIDRLVESVSVGDTVAKERFGQRLLDGIDNDGWSSWRFVEEGFFVPFADLDPANILGEDLDRLCEERVVSRDREPRIMEGAPLEGKSSNDGARLSSIEPSPQSVRHLGQSSNLRTIMGARCTSQAPAERIQANPKGRIPFVHCCILDVFRIREWIEDSGIRWPKRLPDTVIRGFRREVIGGRRSEGLAELCATFALTSPGILPTSFCSAKTC